MAQPELEQQGGQENGVRRDVVVIGAGLAGSGIAAALAQRGWDVLLVERDRFPRHKVCGEFLPPRRSTACKRWVCSRMWRRLRPCPCTLLPLPPSVGRPSRWGCRRMLGASAATRWMRAWRPRWSAAGVRCGRAQRSHISRLRMGHISCRYAAAESTAACRNSACRRGRSLLHAAAIAVRICPRERGPGGRQAWLAQLRRNEDPLPECPHGAARRALPVPRRLCRDQPG